MPKIVRFHQTGGADVLQLEELPTPVPQQGEVRIRVEAIGLNRTEVMFRQGAYLEQPQLPSLIGYEASGIVEEVGPDVPDLKPGDRVSSIPSFSMTQYGTYGEGRGAAGVLAGEIPTPVSTCSPETPNVTGNHGPAPIAPFTLSIIEK